MQKSELIVGARMGADTWELDELEVNMQCTSLIELLLSVHSFSKKHLSASFAVVYAIV